MLNLKAGTILNLSFSGQVLLFSLKIFSRHHLQTYIFFSTFVEDFGRYNLPVGEAATVHLKVLALSFPQQQMHPKRQL